MGRASKIGKAGEAIVASHLAHNGFSGTLNTRTPGATDIVATNPQGGTVRVQVKAARFPNEPADLSKSEQKKIKAAAAKAGQTPVVAQVQVDKHGQPTRPVTYRRVT